MANRPEDREFKSEGELLEYLREHVDDIENVVIPVQEGIDFISPSGQRDRRKHVGAWIKLCSGGSLAIRREDAAMLITDGVLQRMKIKCVLDTLKEP